MSQFLDKYQTTIIRIVTVVGVLLAAFLLVSTLNAAKENRYVGSGLEAKNTITVTGQGKIERAPDTAKITFAIRNESKSVKAAQDIVGGKVDAITKALKDAGIEERHIKTDSYNSYPQYSYPSRICNEFSCPPQQSPTIRGYEVNHTITVSVLDLEKVEAVLGILATNQVSDIQGPNFGFEDDKAIVREARDLAIEDAKEEAKKLAKSLGVDLVRIVSFNEQGGSIPPMYVGNQAMDASAETKVANPPVPVGERNVETNVTIVYEIR